MNRWGLCVEGLGSMVMELSENQMESYLKRIKDFVRIIGRYPDYFEERDIIKQVRRSNEHS